MKRILLTVLILNCLLAGAGAQKVDSFFFNLYTDSLKRGTHNYINIDGKLSNGNWLPLTDKQIQFSAAGFSFVGNDLVVPANCAEEKITVKAVLKSDPAIWKERTIWIKKLPDPDLPTQKEITAPGRRGKKNR